MDDKTGFQSYSVCRSRINYFILNELKRKTGNGARVGAPDVLVRERSTNLQKKYEKRLSVARS